MQNKMPFSTSFQNTHMHTHKAVSSNIPKHHIVADHITIVVDNQLQAPSFYDVLGVWGTKVPPIQWVPGDLSPEVKRLGCVADHSPPTSAEVKETWIYTSTAPYIFMAQHSIG
jgi:hypothetical protein